MPNTSKTLVFFGTEDFSLTALAGLIDAGYTIAAIVTKPDSKKGRGQHLTPPAVKILAERHNIPVLQPAKLAEITDLIQQLDHPTGVLVSYGKIIPQATIDLFASGIINVHPSLLPLYRGPSPIESAIMNGDRKTGVSIMQLSAAMDAGPVYAQKEYSLSGNETQPQLYADLATYGTQVLLDVLPAILDVSLLPQRQDDATATYSHLLAKNASHLLPETLTAREAERKIRAHLSYPKTKYTLLEQDCIITKAHVANTKNTPLDIECRDGAFLSVDELIGPSGKTMNAEAFLRGYARFN